MIKKVTNKATTREQRLYQRDKESFNEYYGKIFSENMNVPDVHLNLRGYTDLSVGKKKD